MSDKPFRKSAKDIKGKPLRGKPFDEFRCFYIKDFRKGDSIRISVKSKDKRFVKGVVTDVDLSNCIIHYRTLESEENITTINHIVSLEAFKKNFLDT
tara:strand:- start:867 stop:1157 length:291 start_codon:yes stop_codon:yes gene_type:complete